ncbi:5'/3'-nucleotidase SurE [Amycolatopsis nigrescens]|uniref:5'/3'-nucleotidase SurE n=1 Tax=Amycolatopsis nigrescens TaxID=381445 RepID=UPI00036F768C|nr:5'/3'-nucleotidase SurE [Amycolatopsis nigrescens]
MTRLRALITNDDGFDSEGLAVLARAAVAAGLEVVVAAPHAEASGTGAGLTVLTEEGRSVIERAHRPGLPDVPCYTVSAHPAFITLAALDGDFGPPPDLVLSGVNRGMNLGKPVIHSGTVGAALTAGTNGVRGLAISVEADEIAPPRWPDPGGIPAQAIELLLRTPAGTVLNVNIPDLPPDALKPLSTATLATAGAVQSLLSHERGGDEVVTTEIGEQAEPGTDVYLVNRQVPTVTALRPVAEDTALDLTGYL